MIDRRAVTAAAYVAVLRTCENELRELVRLTKAGAGAGPWSPDEAFEVGSASLALMERISFVLGGVLHVR